MRASRSEGERGCPCRCWLGGAGILRHLREAESLAVAVAKRIANGTHTAEDAQRLRTAHAGLMADFFSLPLRLQEWLERRYRRASRALERSSGALAEAPQPEPKPKEHGDAKDKPSDAMPPSADSPPADWPETTSAPPPPAVTEAPAQLTPIRCTPICVGQSCRISCSDK